MRFQSLDLEGAWLIDLEQQVDERGWFARTFCVEELAAHGIDPIVAQENLSWNERRGTLRGMHFQTGAAAEGKHVRCTSGEIYDVIVDLRPTSPSYRRWFGTVLTAASRTTLFAPAGVAHGFLTLTDGAEVEYRMTHAYVPGAASGVRWDDPAFDVQWPEPPAVISDRDATWPAWSE